MDQILGQLLTRIFHAASDWINTRKAPDFFRNQVLLHLLKRQGKIGTRTPRLAPVSHCVGLWGAACECEKSAGSSTVTSVENIVPQGGPKQWITRNWERKGI